MSQPVLVVGAGPVGLTLALALRQQEIAVRLVDRAPQPSDRSKALVIGPRTLELLDLHGCVVALLKAGRQERSSEPSGSASEDPHSGRLQPLLDGRIGDQV